MYLNDTIAAIATPMGESGIGIIRVSGVNAKDIGFALLRKPNRTSFAAIDDHRLYYGLVIDPQTNAHVDEVLFFTPGNQIVLLLKIRLKFRLMAVLLI